MLKLFQRGAERAKLRDHLLETIAEMSRTGILPTMPQATNAALGLAGNPDTDLDELCAVIRTDVGLTACVLRLANSVAYARRQPATTLQSAITTVGARKTCDIIVAARARCLYGAAGDHAEALWSHALAVGIAAEQLAKIRRNVAPESTFLPGLLHDIGQIAFFTTDAAAFAELEHAVAGHRHRERTSIELKRWEVDHAEAGGVLAERWGLTAEQVAAIRWHHDPKRAEAHQPLAELIHAADALIHGVDLDAKITSTDGLELPDIGFSPDEWTTAIERVRESVAQQRAVFA
jgi:HD-like signal output (HDOD) protein